MKNSYSPHDFVDLLKNMGYPAEFDCDYHGAGVVATSAEQSSWKWHILFETTDEFEVVDKMLLIGRRLIWNNIYIKFQIVLKNKQPCFTTYSEMLVE